MRAIDFPESNIVYGKPEGWSDEDCMSVPAFKGVDKNGRPFTNIVYMPNKEDIEAILAGRPIVASFAIDGLVPHSLFTFDENGVINE